MASEFSTSQLEGDQAHLGLIKLILNSSKLFWAHFGSFELI